jgi:catechol 2,3-dioxygenase-like lactoylglutathione lyase family enzyme
VTRLVELGIAADPNAWRDVGFAVDEAGVCRIGRVQLRIDPRAGALGLRSWVLADVPDPDLTDVDGIPTTIEPPPSGRVQSAERAQPAERALPPERAVPDLHPLGAVVIDHVVVVTPDLPRTIAAVERGLGLSLRRVRDSDAGGGRRAGGTPMRQAFFWLGEVVLEVVGGAEPDPRGGPARGYGIAITVDDLDAATARLEDRIGPAKDAVQPGRRIATIRKQAGLVVPVALMGPAPDRPVAR